MPEADFTLRGLVAEFAKRGLKATLFVLCCAVNIPNVTFLLMAIYLPTNLYVIGAGVVIGAPYLSESVPHVPAMAPHKPAPAVAPQSAAIATTKPKVEVVFVLVTTVSMSGLIQGAKENKPLSNMAGLMLLKRMGYTDLTVHGFRSTFRDWAAERLAPLTASTRKRPDFMCGTTDDTPIS